MISAPDIAEFIRLIRKDNTGLTGWTRRRSSMRFTLDAIEAYNLHSVPGRFNAIVYAREHIPQAKQIQYADALEHLDEVLRDEGHDVQNQELVRKLADNKFRVTSALGDYRSTFGEPFRTKLTRLGRHDRWLDGGAGQALAMIEYLESGGKAECVATGYAIPEAAVENVRRAEEEYSDQFRYIAGKFFGQISNRELNWPSGGDFDLITDLNGVLFYTETLVEDLERYLEILGANGILCFTEVQAGIDFTNMDFVDDQYPALAKWLANIGGVHVDYHRRGGVYVLSKTGGNVIMPTLELTSILRQSNENNPMRKYRCSLKLTHGPTLQ